MNQIWKETMMCVGRGSPSGRSTTSSSASPCSRAAAEADATLQAGRAALERRPRRAQPSRRGSSERARHAEEKRRRRGQMRRRSGGSGGAAPAAGNRPAGNRRTAAALPKPYRSSYSYRGRERGERCERITIRFSVFLFLSF
jgi:hypothetical protein